MLDPTLTPTPIVDEEDEEIEEFCGAAELQLLEEGQK